MLFPPPPPIFQVFSQGEEIFPRWELCKLFLFFSPEGRGNPRALNHKVDMSPSDQASRYYTCILPNYQSKCSFWGRPACFPRLADWHCLSLMQMVLNRITLTSFGDGLQPNVWCAYACKASACSSHYWLPQVFTSWPTSLLRLWLAMLESYLCPAQKQLSKRRQLRQTQTLFLPQRWYSAQD